MLPGARATASFWSNAYSPCRPIRAPRSAAPGFAAKACIPQHCRQRPILAMRGIGEPGLDHADIGLLRLADLHDGAQIALQIAAGNAEAGAEIGALPDAACRASAPARYRTSRRRCARRLRPSVLATANRGHQAEIDADLGKLGALISHRQDRAGERFEEAFAAPPASGCRGSAQPTMKRSGLVARSTARPNTSVST